MRKPGKRSVRQALEEHGGVVSKVAEAFQVSRQSVYNWIEDYQLQDVRERSRKMMRAMAEDNIFAAVAEGDVETSKFVVRYMPETGRGRWASLSNVNATTASFTLSDEALGILRRMGVEASDAVEEFEAILRAHAEALAVESATESATESGEE